MLLSFTRVGEILRGKSLPVSEKQTQDLLKAMIGQADSVPEELIARAAELFARAQRWKNQQVGLIAVTDPSAGTSAASIRLDDGPEPAGAPDSLAPALRPRRRLLATAAVAGAALASVVGVTTIALGSADSSGAASTSQPTSVTGTTPEVDAEVIAPPAVLLTDNFDGDQLDANRWVPPKRNDLIYAGQGVLNFAAEPQDTRNGVEARLTPKLAEPFREISFTMSVPSFGKSGPGGPDLSIEQASGRNHKVFFGPSSGNLVVGALICSKERCNQYDDFDPPLEEIKFVPGELVPIRVVDNGSRLQFFVKDQLVEEGPTDDRSALTKFSFDLYGANEESWHVTVDSLQVIR